MSTDSEVNKLHARLAAHEYNERMSVRRQDAGNALDDENLLQTLDELGQTIAQAALAIVATLEVRR
jgi:hypothetical protein